MSSRFSNKWNLIRLAISLIFIYILINKFFELESLQILSSISLGVIIVCLSLSLFAIIFKSLRWKYIIDMMEAKASIFLLFPLYTIGFYYGSISPGRVGEFMKGFYLTEHNIGSKKGLISVLYERIFDISTPLGLIVIYYLSNGHINLFIMLTSTFFLAIILWMLAIYFFVNLKNFKYFAPSVTILNNFKIKYNIKYILLSGTASIINWIIIWISAYILLKALGVVVPFSYMVFVNCIAMLSLLIPISINGWGIREAIYASMFQPYCDPSISIIFSVIFAFIGTYFPSIFGLIFELKFKRQRNIGLSSQLLYFYIPVLSPSACR